MRTTHTSETHGVDSGRTGKASRRCISVLVERLPPPPSQPQPPLSRCNDNLCACKVLSSSHFVSNKFGICTVELVSLDARHSCAGHMSQNRCVELNNRRMSNCSHLLFLRSRDHGLCCVRKIQSVDGMCRRTRHNGIRSFFVHPHNRCVVSYDVFANFSGRKTFAGTANTLGDVFSLSASVHVD